MLIKLVSVKIAGYCPHSLFVFFMDWDKVKVHNSAKKKKDSANILPSLPHPWSILYIYLSLDISSLFLFIFTPVKLFVSPSNISSESIWEHCLSRSCLLADNILHSHYLSVQGCIKQCWENLCACHSLKFKVKWQRL